MYINGGMFNAGLLIGEQETHAKTLLDSLYLNGVANDMSETGCGKTYVAVSIASEMNRPVIVICPKPIRNKWMSLLKLAGARTDLVINYEKLVRGNTKWLTYDNPPTNTLTKKPVEIPRWCLTRLHFPDSALVILDEAHLYSGAPFAADIRSSGRAKGIGNASVHFRNLWDCTMTMPPNSDT